MQRLVLLVLSLAIAVQAHAADGTCAGYCKRTLDCWDEMTKVETGQPMTRDHFEQGVAMCVSNCTEQGLPPSILGCLTASACVDLADMEGGRAFKKCEPVGAAAIAKTLELASRTGEACTDGCRHWTACFLGTRATPTFDGALSHLQRCRENCRTTDASWREPYYTCIANLPCARFTREGLLSEEARQECDAAAHAGALGTRPVDVGVGVGVDGGTAGAASQGGEATVGGDDGTGARVGAARPSSVPVPTASSRVPPNAGGKTCDDFCNRATGCATMVDGRLAPRALEDFRLDCMRRCQAGGKSPSEIDCLAALPCWQGMSRSELETAIRRCDRVGPRAEVP